MATSAHRKTRAIRYRFTRRNGEIREFEVQLQLPELLMTPPESTSPPDWTRLDHCQCTHCPLAPGTHPHCPIAANLVPVIEVFSDCISHEQAEIRIQSDARDYQKSAALQTGISSLMGLIMVTSGCPVMDKLRPMVCTHLPFATVEETLFRSVSTYLLAQYFRSRRGRQPDWGLREFAPVYDDVSRLNRCFKQRLESIVTQDANLNALTQLDCFGVFSSLGIEDGGLDEIEQVFLAYLEDIEVPAEST